MNRISKIAKRLVATDVMFEVKPVVAICTYKVAGWHSSLKEYISSLAVAESLINLSVMKVRKEVALMGVKSRIDEIYIIQTDGIVGCSVDFGRRLSVDEIGELQSRLNRTGE